MEPIRQLHDNFKSQSKLIIFCDGKILYDHDQKTYCFDAKDLNSLTDYSPYLSIAKDPMSNEYFYSINIEAKTNILGIFMDPEKIEFTDDVIKLDNATNNQKFKNTGQISWTSWSSQASKWDANSFRPHGHRTK